MNTTTERRFPILEGIGTVLAWVMILITFVVCLAASCVLWLIPLYCAMRDGWDRMRRWRAWCKRERVASDEHAPTCETKRSIEEKLRSHR